MQQMEGELCTLLHLESVEEFLNECRVHLVSRCADLQSSNRVGLINVAKNENVYYLKYRIDIRDNCRNYATYFEKALCAAPKESTWDIIVI